MPRHRILIVDDEAAQRRLFRRLFEAHGYETKDAASAREAQEIIDVAASRPDLVLSDIAMPDCDGAVFVKALREAPATAALPAILMSGAAIPPGMCSAATEALNIGPVFIKGGDFSVLLARVEALLRESRGRKVRIVIDSVKRTISIDGRLLPELPARRYQLLCALLGGSRAMSREELLTQVWSDKDNPNIVDVTILRLRQDLKKFPFLRIETVPAGYRLFVDALPR